MVRARRCTRHVARCALHLKRRLLPFVCCIIEWVHAVRYMVSVVCCMLFLRRMLRVPRCVVRAQQGCMLHWCILHVA